MMTARGESESSYSRFPKGFVGFLGEAYQGSIVVRNTGFRV